MLTYLQGLPPATMAKPDYRYIKRCFTAIKERKNLGTQLEWLSGYTNMTPQVQASGMMIGGNVAQFSSGI